MKLTRVLAYGLPVVAVLGVLGFYPLIPRQHIPRLLKAVSVQITPSCKVPSTTPDPVVSKGDCVNWIPPDSLRYTIDFSQSPNGSPFRSTEVDAGSCQLVDPPQACNSPSTWSLKRCSFPYRLKKMGTLCPDPGVRVVPPTKVSLFFWLELEFHLRDAPQ